ncbi:hypothetical protein N7467_002255 [Penicillium canescens]|nr:hypothetical protein N7467_002255 [Penicillium canescens]
MHSTNPAKVGERLLAALVDEWAVTNPQQPFCYLPNGSSPSDGFHDVLFADVAHATNHLSWWIDTTIGHGLGETLSYIGANDLRYLVLFLACSKAGYKLFLPSTRNSNEAFSHLFKKTQSTILLHSAEFLEKAQTLGNVHPNLKTLVLPSWEDLMNGKTRYYPYTSTFSADVDNVILILHTSGTTGLPKPIYLTHGYFAAFDNISRCPLPPGRKLAIPSGFYSKDDSMLTVTPFFHVMAIFHGTPFAIPPLKPLSGELIINTIKTLKPRAATLPPSLIENICSTKMGMDCLSRLDCLFFGGAPLAFDIGEALRERVRLISLIGSTEMGVILSMAPEESADWAYFDWAPNSNVYMDLVNSELHELVIRRGKDRKVHGIFHTFPDLREYRSQDLFRRHPNRANLWRYAGRLDDVIVLSNGEKFNPIATEKAIEAHPLVSKAIVVGQARFQSAMLIEPNWDLWTDNEHTVEDFLDEVWPLVERANKMVPAYGRVMFNRIGLASKAKPFKVTAKGSTQRRQVNNDYHIEIDSLYAKEPITKLEFPKTPTISSITCYIQQIVHGQLNSPAIDDWADLYAAGLDSLQTASIANMLNKAINCGEPNSEALITAQMVYDHPTISALSHFINSFLHGSRVEMAISRTAKINHVLKTYTHALPEQKALSISRDTCRKHVVLLTGSTGSLGTYILNVLLDDPSVAKIYCLNRSEGAEKNQMKSHHKRGLRVWHLNDDRVEFVHAVFGENHLGLPDTTYYRLLNTVDIIVHNAWDVNFNRSLTSFQPLIKGAYDLFDISRRGRFRPHFFFVSSISTIQNWNISMGGRSAPEDLIQSPDAVPHQGYAESKHVVERLCYHMSSVARVPTTILRVGQIAGPSLSMGNWNRSEWLPALVETSRSLRKIPSHLGNANNIDWIPVDFVADIIEEIMHTRLEQQEEHISATFHVVNPHTSSWQDLIRPIKSKYDLTDVDLSEWIHELELISHPMTQDMQKKPSLKLLPFYRGLTSPDKTSSKIDTSKAERASSTIRNLQPISADLMEIWLQQWEGLGRD